MPLYSNRILGAAISLAASLCIASGAANAETLNEFVLRMEGQPQNRAIAVATDSNGAWAAGAGFGRRTTEAAIEDAMRLCEQRRKQNRVQATCVLLAVN